MVTRYVRSPLIGSLQEDTSLEITVEMLRTARSLVKPSAGDQRKFVDWNKRFGTY